ncbi:MAG: 2,3-bisphosphoglycerate-independent phosphoglycerate mutase [Candidatus Altiarchaeota archaeon]
MGKGVILVIRDGWGYRAEKSDNAIAQTPTPNTDRLMAEYPNVVLAASGEAVGLPDGYQGNSEVGHMTIGSGRIIFQAMVKINKSIKDGSFYENPSLVAAVENCMKTGGRLHVMGLLQSEGVHAHEDHLYAILELCRRKGFGDVVVHVFTDGRDAPVHDSLKHLEKLDAVFKEKGVGSVASVSGRYYSMDRDKRWDRTKKAYDCIVGGEAEGEFDDAMGVVRASHAAGLTDEFIVPTKAKGYKGVKDGDSMFFFNFRTDRTRQLTKAIVEERFEGWERKPLKVYYVGMTQFYQPMNAHIAFEDISLGNLLGKVVGDAGLRQLRISETEKYAHVTFFFNGQVEVPNAGEERILIDSPKVATYDLKPEMSVYEIRDRLVAEIKGGKYDFIVTNLVNCDLVGHTGIVPAIEKAVKSVDDCVGDIAKAGLGCGYTTLVFADHGNAEDQTPEWRTSHTINPVPCIIVSDDPRLKTGKLKTGRGLQDIAPTVLGLLGLKKPSEMTGESLIM